jgi:chromosome segregation ATPase
MLVAGVVFFGGIMSAHSKNDAGTAQTPTAENDSKAKQGTEPQDQNSPKDDDAQNQTAPPKAAESESLDQLKEMNAQLKELLSQTKENDSPLADSLAQLKEINGQLKEIQELLKSGDVRVTVVMNPKPE